MNFTCACGAVVTDTTDGLANKAHLLPDQDLWLFLDAAGAAARRYAGKTEGDERAADLAHELAGLWIRLFRTAYQCPACGRLHLEDRADASRLIAFAPDDPERAGGQLAGGLEE